nr:monocarboxylate transporter 9-like isoform X1 [Ciona intestinalis]|eukprot:XP_002125347.2 monocarboxylate transporter 9-like isoform X1 [Ciona intestinalis]
MARQMQRYIVRPSEAERLKYRWVVLACSFVIRMLVFGSLFSVGVLYMQWLNDFGSGRGETAWIGSIAAGTTLLMGPVGSALLDRFNCRQIIVASGVVLATALIISSFATGIPFLCVSFGVVAGGAGGVANLAAVVSLSQYFDKQRPLAMGVGSSGVGVGAFLFGFLQNIFVEQYTWKGSLLLIGGLQLNVIICGLLMMEPEQLRHYDVIWNWRSHDLNTVHRVNGSTNCNENCDTEILQVLPHKELELAQEKRNDRRRSTIQVIRAKMKLSEKTKTLLKDPTFWILFFSDFLSWLTQFVPYVHLPERALMLGVHEGAFLISMLGVSNAVGKSVFGIICTLFDLSTFNVFVAAQILFGISTLLSPLCTQLWSLSLFAISFGFLSGSYGLMMVIPSKLLGEETFTLAYGLMLAGEGLGVYLGPPIVGWMSDVSNSYDTSFYIAGTCLLLAAVILLLQPIVVCVRRRKKVSIRNAWL